MQGQDVGQDLSGPLNWVLPMPSFLHVQDGEASTSLLSFSVAYVWVAYARSQERMGSIEEHCVLCHYNQIGAALEVEGCSSPSLPGESVALLVP